MEPELCHDISADVTFWKNINALESPANQRQPQLLLAEPSQKCPDSPAFLGRLLQLPLCSANKEFIRINGQFFKVSFSCQGYFAT